MVGEAAVSAAAASSSVTSTLDILGWQALLAAETTADKCRVLLGEPGTLLSERLAQHPCLTDYERKQVANLAPEKVAQAVAAGVHVLERVDFPETMARLAYPPAIFAWGISDCLSQPTIAIVGTRAATIYGKAVAMKFAEAFAHAGVTVISGGALGIDAAAHRGALGAGGSTVAVLAGGIDQVYPAVHDALFAQIRASGCLVSQHAIGSRPAAHRFLSRNLLVAGLAQAVVLVEVPARSGALSTAHAANEQGKDVFVVPANIDNLNFRGSHDLIRDGATLVDHPDQVLEALGIERSAQPADRPKASGVGATIIETLRAGPIPVETIVERSGLTAAEVLAELTLLEIDGHVLRDGGKYAVRP